MPFTPTAILNDVKSGDLDKASAVELLTTIIENSENIQTRLESIKALAEIKENSKKLFIFLENLLISDNNERIRIQSAKILSKLYIDQAIPPIYWALQNEKSLLVQIAIINTLAEINNEKTRSILIKKINEFHKKKYNYNLKEIIEKQDLKNLNNIELAEILINYLVISSLKLEFGRVIFSLNKNGTIADLDLSNVAYHGLGLNQLFNSLGAILSLSFLKRLDLSNNHLKTIPEIINRAYQLEKLDLSYNDIDNLPNSISAFTKLKMLNLKSNSLKRVPETINKLQNLETLILRDNLLNTIPFSIGNLKKLKLIDLHHNQMRTFLINTDSLGALTQLELGWNKFNHIPDTIKNVKSLYSLNFENNLINEVPIWFDTLKNLRQFSIHDNQLKDLPGTFSSLEQLEILNFRNNHFQIIPDCISYLKNLKSLNFSWNNIKEIPKWIDSLKSLELLILWGNQIERIPDEIESLINLKTIYLNFNKFTDTPKEIEILRSKGVTVNI